MIKKYIRWSQRGFTDKLYFLNFCMVWIFVYCCLAVTVAGFFFNITNFDLIIYGIPGAFGELALHTTWVVKKAEKENIAKNKKKNNDIIDLDEIGG